MNSPTTSTASRRRKETSCKPVSRPAWRWLDRDTPLLPRIVAESICGEAATYLRDDAPMRYAPALAARAVRLYAHNATFARRMRAPGNTGREWLRTFMRHWLAARLARYHRRLFDRLPSSYCVGMELPRKRSCARAGTGVH